MPGNCRSTSQNQGRTITANKASPDSQGRYSTFFSCRVQISQISSTRPGSANPIKPFDSTPRAQATNPQRASMAWGLPTDMKDKAKHQMATLIQAATSMSWFTYCPPSRNDRLVPSIQRARRAIVSVANCRMLRYIASSIRPACRAGTSRAAQACTPKAASESASSQYR